MKYHQYSTKVDKGPVIFTIIGLVACLAVFLLLIIFKQFSGLGIFTIVVMGLFSVLCGVLLLGELLDYAYIEEDKLYMRYIFKKTSVKINDIDNLYLNTRKSIYEVYDKDQNLIGTMNSQAIGLQDIILILDKRGVKFK